MNKEERIEYTRLAFTIAGVQIDSVSADLAYQICDTVRKKKGSFSLKDALDIRLRTVGEAESYRVTLAKKEQDKAVFKKNALKYKRFKHNGKIHKPTT